MNQQQYAMKVAQAVRLQTYLYGRLSDQELQAIIASVEAPQPEAVEQEPVVCIGDVWSLWWIGSDPIESIAKRHGLKIGDKLYAAPVAADHIPDTGEMVNRRLLDARALLQKAGADFQGKAAYVYVDRLQEAIAASDHSGESTDKVNLELLYAASDLVSASINNPSCQRGTVQKCYCLECSRVRTRKAIAAAEGGAA
jgi:hypothetical protein